MINMNSYSFDVSGFNKENPDLAREVQEVCQGIGFKGLNNIKIPVRNARNIARKKGVIYNELVKLKFLISQSKEDKYASQHYEAILRYITARRNFITFTGRLRKAVQEFDGKAEKRINKVYYGIYDNPFYG